MPRGRGASPGKGGMGPGKGGMSAQALRGPGRGGAGVAVQGPGRPQLVKTITGAANNGAGLIRITATAHTFNSAETITIAGVVGTVEANGTWTIVVVSANTFDLLGSAFVTLYTSGGTATRAGNQ